MIKVYHKGTIKEIPGEFKEGDYVITYNLPEKVDGKKNPYYNRYGDVVHVQDDDVRVKFLDSYRKKGNPDGVTNTKFIEDGFLPKNLIRLPKPPQMTDEESDERANNLTTKMEQYKKFGGAKTNRQQRSIEKLEKDGFVKTNKPIEGAIIMQKKTSDGIDYAQVYNNGNVFLNGKPLNEKLAELTYIGEDDWSRPAYDGDDGKRYVVVDGVIHSTTPDWEEPIAPARNIVIKRGEPIYGKVAESESSADTDSYAPPEYAIKPSIYGDTGFDFIKKNYRRALWTWNNYAGRNEIGQQPDKDALGMEETVKLPAKILRFEEFAVVEAAKESDDSTPGGIPLK